MGLFRDCTTRRVAETTRADVKWRASSSRSTPATWPGPALLNPKGVFVTTVVIISFHPQFITKVDRAYRIQSALFLHFSFSLSKLDFLRAFEVSEWGMFSVYIGSVDCLDYFSLWLSMAKTVVWLGGVEREVRVWVHGITMEQSLKYPCPVLNAFEKTRENWRACF